MTTSFIATLSIVLVLSGCTSTSEIREFEGYFTYGHEVSDFRKCGSTTEFFWLNGHPEQMKTIEELSLRQAEKIGEPYQEVYVRFSGFAEHREPVGFEEETSGLIYMTQLIDASNQQPGHCK